MRPGLAYRATLVCGIALGGTLGPAVSLLAEDNGADPTGVDRIVLVLEIAEGEELAAQEAQFSAELELLLDRISLERVKTAGADFAALTLQEQLEQIQRIAGEHGAIATVWLEKGGANKLVLHLAATSKGRALVRVVEVELSDEAGAELALAVRELLVKARLVPGPVQEQETAEVPQGKNQDQKPKEHHWNAVTFFRTAGGIAGHSGPSLLIGGGLALEWWPADFLLARLSASGYAGPRDRVADGVIQGWRFEPNLAVGYVFQVTALKFGPVLSIAVPWTAMDIALGSGDNESYGWWTLRSALGLDLRYPLGRIFAVTACADVGVFPKREVFRRLSDRSTVIITPRFDWSLLFGAAIFID